MTGSIRHVTRKHFTNLSFYDQHDEDLIIRQLLLCPSKVNCTSNCLTT